MPGRPRGGFCWLKLWSGHLQANYFFCINFKTDQGILSRHIFWHIAVVAEWLRRQTRNLLGSARAGSNPADCASVLSDQDIGHPVQKDNNVRRYDVQCYW